MSASNKKFLFLGLPGSGKTTYFAAMAQYFQDLANLNPNFKLRFCGSETGESKDGADAFINKCTTQLRGGHWPDKTEEPITPYNFQTIEHRWLYDSSTTYVFCDCSGEAFRKTFMEEKPSAEIEGEEKVDLRPEIDSACGVFLVLDAVRLFNPGGYGDEVARTLTNLFRHCKNHKVAIVFTKLEAFFGEVPDMKSLLREKYPNVFAHCPAYSRYFDVYPLGSVVTSEDGETLRVPHKRDISSHGVLEPIEWLLGLGDKLSKMESAYRTTSAESTSNENS